MPPKRKKTGNQKGYKKRKAISRSRKNDIASDDKNSAPVFNFTCRICSDSFEEESKLQNHLVDCKKSSMAVALRTLSRPALKCSECNKFFKYKKNFLSHRKNEHAKNRGSLACSKCNARCPNKTMLKRHVELVHNRDEYICNHCKKTFVRRAHVLRHMAQSGCDGSQATAYPCEICPAIFSRKDNLIVHLRSQHVLRKNYTCKYCSFTTRNFSKNVRHWQFYHFYPRVFECDICAKTTSSRTSMAKHLEIHGEKKHSCDVCGYKTFTAEVLKRHVLTHVKDKPHKCDVCGESYIQRLQLQRHLAKHTGNVCEHCGEAFPNRSRLLVHQRHHMGLDRLVCPIKDCNVRKEYDNESSLHGHVQTHLTSKDYKCEVCEKSFCSEVNMKRHVSTHRLDRPRRCMYCVTARAYIRGEQLLRHVRRLHPDLFRQHLAHVRRVLGTDINVNRVKKSEMESILNVLDAESDRIMDGYGGSDVLYGGVQDDTPAAANDAAQLIKIEDNPLMSEQELEDNLKMLLQQLIDIDTLKFFGWPDESVDSVLEKVIEHCGAKSADPLRWTRVQRLRENAKHLFLYAVEDKHIARMLDTHTIDQVVKHILTQVSPEQ